MRRAGFTLMELLVVVVMLGILAGIALPNLRKTTELGYKREATDMLLTIYSAERAYFAHHQVYQGDLGPMADWRAIGIDDPNSLEARPVEFTVDADNSVDPKTFTATADRGNGDFLTIDDTRFIQDSWTIP